MQPVETVGLRIFSVLLLIAINAFFVTAEFSIVSVRRSRINQLVDAGDVPALTVQNLQRSIDRLLSTTQLGITLSSLALGWIGERAMAGLVSEGLNQLPLPLAWRDTLANSLALPITFLGIAYLQIVLGELCPKSVALLYSEELARFLGAPSLAIARIFNPFIWILNQSTKLLLRLVGIQYTGQGWYNQVTPEELQLIITTSSESTGLEAEERELLRNVFEFSEVTASEVMVPRTTITAVTDDATWRSLLEVVAETGHSRYPVTGESLDDIRGIIHFKELAEPLAEDAAQLDQPIQPWIRPARFVPEYMLLSELLPLMQQSRQPMVMVVDEFGGTAGLITIENIVAEILGETIEPDPSDVPPMQQIDEQTYLVQAQLNLEEVNEALNADLPITDDYQTLAGFLLYELQHIPSQGETLRFAGYEFTVMAIDGPRIDQIQIRQLELPTLEEASTQGDILDSEADVAPRDRTAEATAPEKPPVEQRQPSNNGSSTNSDQL
jgi:CBS domain containing-hemolysin-like protein